MPPVQMTFLSALLTVGLCMIGPRLAVRLKLVDLPGGRKHHAKPTPLLGALAMLLVVLPLAISLPIWLYNPETKAVLALIFSASALSVIGLLDDRNHMDPKIRLALTIIVFAVCVATCPEYFAIQEISWNGNLPGHGIDLGYFSIPASILCLTTLVNAINLADGKNGLALGMMFGWSVILLVAAPYSIVMIMAIIIGTIFVLLLFNLKDRLFLGDGGSYGFSGLIGLLSLFIYQRSGTIASADQVGLMFMVPVGDMIRLMIGRLLRGGSPFTPDRDHLHHLLLDGLGWSRGLLVYLTLIFGPMIFSITNPSSTLKIIALTFTAYWIIVLSAHQISRARRS